MSNKIVNWLNNHPKVIDKACVVLSAGVPALFGYMVYKLGKESGSYEEVDNIMANFHLVPKGENK